MIETTKVPKVETLAKLVAAMKDEHDKLGALIDECDAILGGRQTIGDKLKTLEESFTTCWSMRYGGRYAWNYAKDRPQMKRLIRILGEVELAARMGRYLANADPFYLKSGHTFALFVASVNTHAAPSALPDAIDDDVAATKRLMQELRK